MRLFFRRSRRTVTGPGIHLDCVGGTVPNSIACEIPTIVAI